jgi:hypothetical protein
MRAVAILLCAFLAGCAKGTGTGNPEIPTSAPNNPAGPGGGSIVSSNIFQQLCASIAKCHPQVTIVDCELGISGLTGFAPALGIRETPEPTVAEIVAQEEAGDYFINFHEANACATTLGAADCQEPAMQAAYQPNLSQPFALSVNLLALSPDCSHAFGPTPLER